MLQFRHWCRQPSRKNLIQERRVKRKYQELICRFLYASIGVLTRLAPDRHRGSTVAILTPSVVNITQLSHIHGVNSWKLRELTRILIYTSHVEGFIRVNVVQVECSTGCYFCWSSSLFTPIKFAAFHGWVVLVMLLASYLCKTCIANVNNCLLRLRGKLEDWIRFQNGIKSKSWSFYCMLRIMQCMVSACLYILKGVKRV